MDFWVDHQGERRSAMRIPFVLIAMSVATSASAILPPPTAEAKAQATIAAAKSAWSDKVSAYQLCVVGDRLAVKYRQSLKASMKDIPPPAATPACADPGPFVPPVVAEAKPLEAAGAHSPPETATAPPSSKATAAELAGGIKK